MRGTVSTACSTFQATLRQVWASGSTYADMTMFLGVSKDQLFRLRDRLKLPLRLDRSTRKKPPRHKDPTPEEKGWIAVKFGLVIPADIMNLPALYGFLKFPDGFPATRIRLEWRHYPEVAEPYRRRTTLTPVAWTPPPSSASGSTQSSPKASFLR